METRFYSSPPHWTHMLWFLERRRAWFFAALGLLYLAGFNGQWRITADSALHVDAARVLVAGGEPVVAEHSLSALPPGLAYTLAVVGGSTGWPASLLMLGVAAAVLAITYRLFIRHADRPTAVLMVLLLGTNRFLYEMSFSLLTELPFALGFALLLWGHERRLKRKGGLGVSLAMMGVGLLVMAAFRSVAAVVVAGYLVAELIRVVARRRQRRLGLALLGFAGAAGVGLWLASPAVRADALLFRDTLRALDGERLLTNAHQLFNEVLPEALLGQDIPPPLSWAVSAGVVVTSLLAVRARLLWAVLLGVFALQWLVFLADARYVVPLLPILIYAGWRLLIAGCERLPGRVPGLGMWRNLAFGFVLVCVAGSNLVGVGFVIAEQRAGPFYETYRNGKYAAVLEVADAVRDDSRGLEDAVVVTAWPVRAELSVLSGRPVWEVLDDSLPADAAVFAVVPAGDEFPSGWGGWIAGPAEFVARDRVAGGAWSLHRMYRTAPGSP